MDESYRVISIPFYSIQTLYLPNDPNLRLFLFHLVNEFVCVCAERDIGDEIYRIKESVRWEMTPLPDVDESGDIRRVWCMCC